MRHLLVLGAGTAGTMIVNKLRPELRDEEWDITVVDQSATHPYQPGYLFVPFGVYTPAQIVKPIRELVPPGVAYLNSEIDVVDPDGQTVRLTDGTELAYDYLVIATGTHPRPDQTPGMSDGAWRRSVHEFYTLEGAQALADAFQDFDGGRLVVSIVEMPIKCPVAPLEFAFLADAHFEELGIRDDVELTYVTPLPDAFTKPVASQRLGGMLEERNIALETDFYTERIDPDRNVLVSYDEREVPFDLLVTVPINMGADFVARSGLGDELNHVPVDKHTFISEQYSTIFAIGDAAALPTSKAGSVAHFSVEVFAKNFLELIEGRPMTEHYDGHANCFIESGHGKGMLIDFNYDTEPLPGKYPIPGVGPFSLLEETAINHRGKMFFKWMYWNMLLPGHRLPLPAHMTMLGKERVDA